MTSTLNGIAVKLRPIYESTEFLLKQQCEVFFDPFFHVQDAGLVEGEPREAVIGLTINWRLLYVAYMMREEDVIRIVSARPATAKERKLYEDQ